MDWWLIIPLYVAGFVLACQDNWAQVALGYYLSFTAGWRVGEHYDVYDRVIEWIHIQTM